MLKLPVEEMQMSMSDAALSQPDTAPSMVGNPFVCTCGREEYLKCLGEHISQVNSDSAPPAVYTKLFVALQFTVYPGWLSYTTQQQ